MSEPGKGIAAMIAACTIWGLSPLYYKELAHIAPAEVLAHRAFWSLAFFAGLLLLQGRLREVRLAFSDRRRFLLLALAMFLISINWFLFILSVQIGRTTEASLGYYIYPLVAVLIGRFAFSEQLRPSQWVAVGLAALAVIILTWGLGVAPWISLTLAGTFGFYGMIKKNLPLGPVVSVTCEILLFLPVALIVLGIAHGTGQGAFGGNWKDSLLLSLAGPITAGPLILFSAAARRVAMSTVGILQYINPTLQFLCAVLVFAEPFTRWHAIAFCLIWAALALYSITALRQDRAARKASMAVAGVSTTVK